MCRTRCHRRRRTSSSWISGVGLPLFSSALVSKRRKIQTRTLRVQPFDEALALAHESAEEPSALNLDAVSSWCGVNAKRVEARDCNAILSSEFSSRATAMRQLRRSRRSWQKNENRSCKEFFCDSAGTTLPVNQRGRFLLTEPKSRVSPRKRAQSKERAMNDGIVRWSCNARRDSFNVERAWETRAGGPGAIFLFVSLRPDTIRLVARQLCSPTAEMPSPNGDTRAQVVVAYQGHPVFICAQCATVIVRGVFICVANALLGLTVVVDRHFKMS